MTRPAELHTSRLLLRAWRPADREPFAALNADPAVMEHFPATLDREQSDALADTIEARFAMHGWGLWAVEVKASGEFAGFVGLAPITAGRFPFRADGPEVGWRLARRFWGAGYATEAAREALRHGFEVVGAREIVSFTATTNQRSQAVMRRLGMGRDPREDFDHPSLPERHPLRRHVLYRLGRDQWVTASA